MPLALILSIVWSVALDRSDPWDGRALPSARGEHAPRLLIDTDDPWIDSPRSLDALDPWDGARRAPAAPSRRVPRIDGADPWVAANQRPAP